MDIDKKISTQNDSGKDFSDVSGGKRVNFFGFKSKTGNYTKCDLCGKYGTVPLSNGVDICLHCLEKVKNIIGPNNTFKLLAPNSGEQKEILSPNTIIQKNTNNTKK